MWKKKNKYRVNSCICVWLYVSLLAQLSVSKQNFSLSVESVPVQHILEIKQNDKQQRNSSSYSRF